MSNCAVVEENPDATKYAEEKYQKFLRAETPEQALPHLWHVSQLVHKLPDERVKKVIYEVKKSQDSKMHAEGRYLAGRWVNRFVVGFGIGSGVLILLCIVFLVLGLICKWPSELTLVISYILGAFGLEGWIATLILFWKKKTATANEIRS